MEIVRVIPGNLIFTRTDESILGRRIECLGTIFGLPVYKRRIPKLNKNFQPGGQYYEKFELIIGRASYYFETKVSLALRAMRPQS